MMIIGTLIALTLLPWLAIIAVPVLILIFSIQVLLVPIFQKSKESLALIIDDDEAAVSYLTSILEVKGHKVKSFLDPRKGLDYLLKHNWNVLAVDYDMPELKGDEIIKKLNENFRQDHQNSKKVFYFTGKKLDLNQNHTDKLNFLGIWDKKLGINDEILEKLAA